MNEIVIIGAGGFGREVAWLIERINKVKKNYKLLGFIDDNVKKGIQIDNYSVLGTINELKRYEKKINVCIAIGNAKIRKKIYEKIKINQNLNFPNLIDPSVLINENNIGKGNIICANNIFTVGYKVNDFCIINLSCTIGHDVLMKSFVTVYPGVNISGNVNIEECVELGTGSSIIQGVSIGKSSIIGASACVIKDIESNVTAVGLPAKSIKKEG